MVVYNVFTAQSSVCIFFLLDEPAGTSSDPTGAVVGVVLSVVIILSVGVALATIFIVWRKRKVVMLSNVTHIFVVQFTTGMDISSSSIVVKVIHHVQ